MILLWAYIQVIVTILSAASSILNVAIYRYALTHKLHGGFSEEQFKSAWVPKN